MNESLRLVRWAISNSNDYQTLLWALQDAFKFGRSEEIRPDIQEGLDAEPEYNDILDQLTEPGKTVTVNLKIVDQAKAKELLKTLYKGFYTPIKQSEEFGVTIEMWGDFDLIQKHEQKINLLHEKVKKSLEDINTLINTDLRDIEL
jgi:hypothetical protein